MRTFWRKIPRGVKIAAAVLLVLIGIAGGRIYYQLWHSNAPYAEEIDTYAAKAQAAIDERQALIDEREQLESNQWLESAFTGANTFGYELIFDTVREHMRKPEEIPATSIAKSETQIDMARKAGRITDLEKSLDPAILGRSGYMNRVREVLNEHEAFDLLLKALRDDTLPPPTRKPFQISWPYSQAAILLLGKGFYAARDGDAQTAYEIVHAAVSYRNKHEDLQNLAADLDALIARQHFNYGANRVLSEAVNVAPPSDEMYDALMTELARVANSEEAADEILRTAAYQLRHGEYRFSPYDQFTGLGYYGFWEEALYQASMADADPNAAAPPAKGNPGFRQTLVLYGIGYGTQSFGNALSYRLGHRRQTEDAANHMRLMLAVTKYRADHGAFPDTLEALVPEYIEEIPADPNTGTPYQEVRLFLEEPAFWP